MTLRGFYSQFIEGFRRGYHAPEIARAERAKRLWFVERCKGRQTLCALAIAMSKARGRG